MFLYLDLGHQRPGKVLPGLDGRLLADHFAEFPLGGHSGSSWQLSFRLVFLLSIGRALFRFLYHLLESILVGFYCRLATC